MLRLNQIPSGSVVQDALFPLQQVASRVVRKLRDATDAIDDAGDLVLGVVNNLLIGSVRIDGPGDPAIGIEFKVTDDSTFVGNGCRGKLLASFECANNRPCGWVGILQVEVPSVLIVP